MKGIIYTKDIYREIVPKIIQDEASWSRFLAFSSNLYHMGFENASLIYAQRPDARLVETYTGWRDKGRYVRRGSKGIAIIDSAHYKPYVDHVFDVADTSGRAYPEIWRFDQCNEKEILALLHAGAENREAYVKEAVEKEFYGSGKKYLENIGDLCRCHDSQNPEHIYDITNALVKSAEYMAACRIMGKPPPAAALFPVLPTAPKLMVYGLCNTALMVAGQVLTGIEKVFDLRRTMEKGKEQGIGQRERDTGNDRTGQGIKTLRDQPHQNTGTLKRQGDAAHKRDKGAGYEQLSLSFDGGHAFYDCRRA